MSSEYSIQMILFETQKYIYVPQIKSIFLFFFFNIWSYSQPSFDIAPNFGEVDVENDNVVLTTMFCSDQRQNRQR